MALGGDALLAQCQHHLLVVAERRLFLAQPLPRGGVLRVLLYVPLGGASGKCTRLLHLFGKLFVIYLSGLVERHPAGTQNLRHWLIRERLLLNSLTSRTTLFWGRLLGFLTATLIILLVGWASSDTPSTLVRGVGSVGSLNRSRRRRMAMLTN